MIAQVLLRPNTYCDSVSLMALSQEVLGLPGVAAAVVAMGTDMNKELLGNVGLLTPAAAAAGPADLVLAVGAASAEPAAAALAHAEAALGRKARSGGQGGRGAAAAPRTVRAAARAEPEAGLALISVPGAYAAREARLALEQGLHVMLYSDNVSVESEIALKARAHAQGLLLMGPDCGTAIIDGVGLGFANAVRRGPIGVVAASGTGAQELSCLVDRLGSGISQLIGVGGRDLSAAVGGVMMTDGIHRLAADPETAVIVLISKPPAPAVLSDMQHVIAAVHKPTVVCFLGGDLSLDEAAVRAVALATGQGEAEVAARLGAGPDAAGTSAIGPAAAPSGSGPGTAAPERRYVRGLFCGGTLCDQALAILERSLGPVACNVHPVAGRRDGATHGVGHTLVDLGDDEFTRGRPHPMIDNTLRRMHLLEAAADPTVAVILLDVVIGYGAHADPAGALAEAIAQAVHAGVTVVASVTGTEADPQRLSRQEATLRATGARVFPTARQAAMAVAASLKGRG